MADVMGRRCEVPEAGSLAMSAFFGTKNVQVKWALSRAFHGCFTNQLIA
jgi:hypothetical protein